MYTRTAVRVKGYVIHRATTNGYCKEFYIVAYHFQNIESIIAYFQVNSFIVDRGITIFIIIHNVGCIALYGHFIGKGKFRCSVAYLAVNFRSVHGKSVEQNACFHLENVTTNGAGLRRGCRCRRTCHMLVFAFFVTANTFMPMVGRVARPFFSVFVGELVDRLGFCIRFTNRTRISRYTFFRAGRRFSFRAIIPSMLACCRDFLVRCIVTTRTGFIRLPTLFSAGCFLCAVLYFVMFQGRDFLVCCIVTTRTGFVCMPTLFRAGCFLCAMLYFVMFQGRNFLVRCIITTRTGFVCIPTFFRASCFLCAVLHFVMLQRRDCFRIGFFFADHTGKRFFAFFRTSGRNRFLAIAPSMLARRRNFFRVAIITRTSVSNHTFFRAGRFRRGLRRVTVRMFFTASRKYCRAC